MAIDGTANDFDEKKDHKYLGGSIMKLCCYFAIIISLMMMTMTMMMVMIMMMNAAGVYDGGGNSSPLIVHPWLPYSELSLLVG